MSKLYELLAEELSYKPEWINLTKIYYRSTEPFIFEQLCKFMSKYPVYFEIERSFFNEEGLFLNLRWK